MGFDEKWIALIMECVETMSYSILVNGQPGKKIFPSRGIRQGGQFSPYLFILCAKGLSALMDKSTIKWDTK